MKNKKWLLVLIIAFPSLFWLILETSTINSNKLPVYGPKKVNTDGDTSYYKVSDHFYLSSNGSDSLIKTSLDTNKYPLYAVIFISDKYRKDSYRLAGLWEYLNYKKEKINHIPFILVTEFENGKSSAEEELKKLNENSNVHFMVWPKYDFEKILKSYFNEKPYYIDYSFFLLVDGNRHIRGYYDGRYVAEIKRLIGEHQYLRLKEEKERLIENNEIKNAN